jgi:hypothetical protein
MLILVYAGAAHADVVARLIDDEADLFTGEAADGQLGDFLMSNGAIAVIVSGQTHTVGSSESGGNIIDVAPKATLMDEFEYHLTLLVDYPRQAVYDSVSVESDGSMGTAVIRAVGWDSGNGNLRIVTRYSLNESLRHVSIETSIENLGGTVVGYEAGDVLDWGNTLHFVPGYGTDVSGTTTQTEWTAGKGGSTCYAYTKATGSFSVSHGSSWSDPVVFTSDIPAGEIVTFTRYMAVGQPDLAAVSDAVHEIRGLSTGLLEVSLLDDSTSLGIENALIPLAVNGVAPYTEVISGPGGVSDLTLPQANFQLEASPPGYFPGEENVFVIAGVTTEVELRLIPTPSSEGRGDTLTVVMRPIMSVPAITTAGSSFAIEAIAPISTTSWSAHLTHGSNEYPLGIWNNNYDYGYERWFMSASVPTGVPAEVYDLVVEASGGISDTIAHAVAVKSAIEDDFYFIHVTDTHLPTHKFHYQQGADSDTTEMDDYRAVIDDVNIINPAFVIHTGDLVNEGELEDYLGWHVFTRAHRISCELDVPVFIVGGNHDLGGWDDTPPSDGTARRDWWSFFGWRYLADPPPDEYIFTQNYSFDYAQAHFTGMEAYDNYDSWRYWIYGPDSFTSRQMNWLYDDLALADPSAAKILFYHYDFSGQIDLEALGVDCALWGHIHSTSGSITQHPYDLSCEAACDGGRAFRLMRVSGNTIIPSEPLAAGDNGEELKVTYYPENDGTTAIMGAVILNDYPESFEHAMIKFHVPADSIPYAVDNGTLAQTIVDGDVATCYVNIPLSGNSTEYINIAPTTDVPDTTEISVLALARPYPNPARTRSSLSFVIPSVSVTRLEIYDLTGRKVRTLLDEVLEPGLREVVWNLENSAEGRVAAGVYFCRLEAAGESITRKLIVLK